MNKKCLLIITLIFFSLPKIYAGSYAGTLDQQVMIAPGAYQTNQISFYSSSGTYVNGGLTFSFPAGTFTQAPNVTVSLQATNFVSGLLSARIVSSTANAVTISVNSGTLLSITELLSGAATVNIWAVGN